MIDVMPHGIAMRRYNHVTKRVTPYMGREQSFQTAALLWAGDVELAREDLHRFDAQIGQQPRYQIGSWCAHAALAAETGDVEYAVALLEQAAATAKGLGLRGELWSNPLHPRGALSGAR
jgi:hypothetical protein